MPPSVKERPNTLQVHYVLLFTIPVTISAIVSLLCSLLLQYHFTAGLVIWTWGSKHSCLPCCPPSCKTIHHQSTDPNAILLCRGSWDLLINIECDQIGCLTTNVKLFGWFSSGFKLFWSWLNFLGWIWSHRIWWSYHLNVGTLKSITNETNFSAKVVVAGNFYF